MKPIQIFTHVLCEPAGYLQSIIDRLGLPWQQVCLYEGQQNELAIDDVSALVFMGGPGNVNTPTDWMQRELALIQRAAEANVPMLGICLGAQLMSRALGGDVWPGDDLEVGWARVQLNEAGRAHPWFAGVEEDFPAFQWHAHCFTPPAAAQSLAFNDCTPCQAWAMGQHLALQFHLEMTEEIIRSIIDKYASDLAAPSRCVQTGEQILAQAAQQSQQVFGVADRLLVNWFRAVLPEIR